MRILGVDPGYAIVGWGILDYEKAKFQIVDFGAITTDKDTPFGKRLQEIEYPLEKLCVHFVHSVN
ncbi:MAG: crossover junction endodeoxyribonuclease RuvC [Clostridia bacterium]|nr:crossover junction endodeoxyribonuclease RuvC [Clostridia bacterium]